MSGWIHLRRQLPDKRYGAFEIFSHETRERRP